MKKGTRLIYVVLVFMIFSYYIIGTITNGITYAANTRYRDSNLDNLNNSSYPGVLSLIRDLQVAHPNWTFTILYTGLDWETVITNETTMLHGRSLVQNSSPAWICSICGSKAYDNGTWYCASAATVKYYMDIRNWLNESYIFSFETLSYDPNIHTIDGVKAILNGTFMDKDSITYTDTAGNIQTINKSYADIIMEAAREYNVSPYHLASRMRQEQGVDGTSSLISGNSSYQDSEGNPLIGYYNYFNIGASGNNTATICINGLVRARSKGWTTPELAIKGGAEFIAAGYINNYQDCLYLEKYQVDMAGGLYSHQYMQNVSAPYSEGYEVYKAYKEIGVLNNNFNFIIPVYENMPNTFSAKPTVVMNIVTENVRISTASSDLPLRVDMSASSTKLIDLPRNSIVLRIEQATAKQNGYYWDKVVYDTGNGIYIGYANSEYLTRTDDRVTVNEAFITSTDVNLRNGPGLSGTSVIKTIASGAAVTVIDKMTYEIDGYIWYRIKLSDGKQGYVAAKYLTSNTPTVKYKVDGTYIFVIPQSSIEDIEGGVNQSSTYGTGAQIYLNNTTYTLVMLGDVNGDGKVKATDYILIKNYIMDGTGLDEYKLKAADVNKDGNVKATDYILIKNYIMDGNPINL